MRDNNFDPSNKKTFSLSDTLNTSDIFSTSVAAAI